MKSHHKKESKLLKENSIGSLLAEGLEELASAAKEGVEQIPEKFTCHKFTLDLKPTTYGKTEVRATRKLLGASQAVFAQFLGVTVKTVRAWEQGINIPSDGAARMMDEIRHNPTYFKKRMAEVAIAKTDRKYVAS